MRICLTVEGQEGVAWDQWRSLAEAVEAAGLEGLFRSDHYRSITRGEPAGSLDAWATLAALGAVTQRIRLGTMVSPVTFRSAAVLAKNVTTVDHISAGRAELGVGAGWHEPEHTTYRMPFGTVRERLDELDRQLEEITRQWTSADDIRPTPIQKPRPPIIVGGRAKPRTIAAAVQFADEYNTISPSLEEARERGGIVALAAETAGREPLVFSMTKACVVGRDRREVQERVRSRARLGGRTDSAALIQGTVKEVAQTVRRYSRVGVERVMLQHLHHEDIEMIALLGEVADELRGVINRKGC